jgi:DNA polymerase sigma
LSKGIDKLKKLKYKVARLEGENIKNSLLEAGYSKSTAHQSSTNSIVKQCEPELALEVKASDISVDWVISKLNTELQSIHAKSSDRVRILELLGKYLNMFRDNQTTNVGIFGLNSKDIADLPITEPPKVQEVITKIVDNSVDN